MSNTNPMESFYNHVRDITYSNVDFFGEQCKNLFFRIIKDIEKVIEHSAQKHNSSAYILAYPLCVKVGEYYIHDFLFQTKRSKELFAKRKLTPIFSSISERMKPFKLEFIIYDLSQLPEISEISNNKKAVKNSMKEHLKIAKNEQASSIDDKIESLIKDEYIDSDETESTFTKDIRKFSSITHVGVLLVSWGDN